MCCGPAFACRKIVSGNLASRDLWTSIVDEASEPPPAKSLQDFTRYAAKGDEFDTAMWQHVAIPTITVHLTELAATIMVSTKLC